MKIIKDHEGKVFYIQARHISIVAKSEYTTYAVGPDNAEDLPATTVTIYGCMIEINEPLDSVVRQLGL